MAELILRIGVFSTFIGHGIISLQAEPHWLSYLTTLGFSTDTAITIMPVIGTIDIILACWVLVKPNKYLIFWMFLWAFLTTVVGTIVEDSIVWLAVLSANWVVPLALLYIRRFNR